MKRIKNLDWKTLFIVVLAIVLISVTVFVLNNEKAEIAKQEPQKIYVGHDEKVLDNFSREHAVKALKDILIEIGKNDEGEEWSIDERMEILSDGKADMKDVLSSKTIDKLYFSEDFSKVKFNRQFTASALLVYYKILEENGLDNFESAIDFYDEIVYLDNKFLTAHIPMDIFLGKGTGIAFEMQYVTGEWKLNPYTVTMSLTLMGILGEDN